MKSLTVVCNHNIIPSTCTKKHYQMAYLEMKSGASKEQAKRLLGNTTMRLMNCLVHITTNHWTCQIWTKVTSWIHHQSVCIEVFFFHWVQNNKMIVESLFSFICNFMRFPLLHCQPQHLFRFQISMFIIVLIEENSLNPSYTLKLKRATLLCFFYFYNFWSF